MRIEEIDYAEYEGLLQNGQRFMLELFLEKCEPCKELLAELEDLQSLLAFPIYKMDILKNRKIYHELGLKKSPTVLVFESGQELGRVVEKQERFEYLKLAGTRSPEVSS